MLDIIKNKGMKAKITTITYFTFNCPGCQHQHTIPIGGSNNDWIMSGNVDCPTLNPSVLNIYLQLMKNQNELKCVIFLLKMEALNIVPTANMN